MWFELLLYSYYDEQLEARFGNIQKVKRYKSNNQLYQHESQHNVHEYV